MNGALRATLAATLLIGLTVGLGGGSVVAHDTAEVSTTVSESAQPADLSDQYVTASADVDEDATCIILMDDGTWVAFPC